MGRKVTDNHKVVEQNSQGAAEELVKQQNAAEDFVLGEREEEPQEADAGKEEGQQKEGQQDGGEIGATDQEEALSELPGIPLKLQKMPRSWPERKKVSRKRHLRERLFLQAPQPIWIPA